MATTSGLSSLRSRVRGIVDSYPARPTTDQQRPIAEPATGPRQFLIHSTQKVIEHYRRVLTKHQMSEAEQEAIRARLAEQDRLLNDLLRSYARPTHRGVLEAA
jgi:hypothetical protein